MLLTVYKTNYAMNNRNSSYTETVPVHSKQLKCELNLNHRF